jgi:hypothetical protein
MCRDPVCGIRDPIVEEIVSDPGHQIPENTLRASRATSRDGIYRAAAIGSLRAAILRFAALFGAACGFGARY